MHRRPARSRLLPAVLAVLASLAAMLAAVSQPAAAATPASTVVLDPDDNYSHAIWNSVSYTELPITYAIAVGAKAKLQKLCDTNVSITRDASQNFVSRTARAAQMRNATVSMTLSLNNLTGSPWGTSADGGSIAFASNYANNLGLAKRTLDAVTQFTGRRNAGGPNQGGTNGTVYPYPEFATLPGTYAQAFLLYMDHNFDWPAIDSTYDGAQYGYLIDAVVTAVGQQLQAQGISCGNTAAGQTAFPSAPSAAQLAALFALGFANWMRYGSDPVNLATGNFVQQASLFTVAGPGGVSTPVALTYNSLDSRSGSFGRGWSSGLDVRSQTYADGSVLVTGDDGSATAFDRNPDGSYRPVQPGIFDKLARTAANTIVLTAPDTSTQTFTENPVTGAGVLVKRTDRAGHSWSYGHAATTTTTEGSSNPWPVAPNGSSGGSGVAPVTYQTLGALTSITEPGGQIIRFASDSAGHVTKVSRPDGASWTLAYTGDDLSSITDADGHTTRYGYDTSGRIVTVTAPDGVTYLHNSYDTQGRVVKQVNGEGNSTSISYAAGQTSYTDTAGATTTFTVDSTGRVTKVVTPLGHAIATGYDNWQTSSSTDADGNTTSYAYDSAGNLTSVTAPSGAETSYGYTSQGDLTSQTDANGRTTSYTVDSHGHTTAIAGPDGAHWQQSFDAAGNLSARTDPDGHTTKYGYDVHGDLTAVTDAAGGITKLSYDTAGRVSAVDDPLGRITDYSYDAVGNLTALTKPSGAKTRYAYQADDQVATITDPNGHSTRYTYTAELNVASITDANGGVTTLGYDSEGRRTSVTDPNGHVTRYAYNAEGLLVGTTDPAGGVTKRAYDAAQQLTSVTDPTGATTTIGYTVDGLPVKVTDARGGVTTFSYDAAGQLTSVTDQDKRGTTYAYDPAGRVVTVTDAPGHVSKYSYDAAGNQTSSTDETGRTTSFAYDALNRVITKDDPAGAKTAYAYDAAGELTKVTDPVGRTASYRYTADGQLAGTTDPAAAKTSYAYDPAGNVTGITDARGGQVQFAWTATNQLAASTDADGNTTHYAYDAAGQLTGAADPLGVLTGYTHDQRGLLTSVTENAISGAVPSASTNATTKYAYDAAGRLTGVTDPLGHTKSDGYDATGDLTSATDPLGHVTRYSYDAAGQLTARTDGAGTVTSFGYDAAGHLTGVIPASPQPAVSYGYDAAGRMTTMHDGTGASTWTYDSAGRVTAATSGAGTTLKYGYDASGVRTSLTYPDGRAVAYGLDAVGRVASETDASGTVKYSYDAAGEVTGVARPNGTTSSYFYDPDGLITQIMHTGTTATSSGQGPGCGNGGTTPGCPSASPDATPAVPNPVPSGSASSSATSSAVASATPADPTPSARVPASLSVSPANSATATTSPSTPSGQTDGPGCGNGGVTPGCPVVELTAADGLPMTLSYSYDADGRVSSLRQQSVSKDLTTSYRYDSLGRLISSTRTDGADASYSYDAAGDRVGGTDTDRVSGQVLSVQASFDAAEQLVSQTVAPQGAATTRKGDVAAGTVVTSDVWNGDGQLSGSSVASTSAGPGNSGKTDTATVSTTNTYDYAGRLTASSRSDGAATSYGYDGLGRTVGMMLPDPTAAGGAGGKAGNGAGSGKSGGPGCGNGGSTPGCPAVAGDTVFGGAPVTVTNDGATPVAFSTAAVSVDLMYGPQGVDHQVTTTAASSAGAAATKAGGTGSAGSASAGATATSVTGWLYLDALGSVRVVSDSAGQTVAAAAYTDFGGLEPASGSVFCGDKGNSSCAPGQLKKLSGPVLPAVTGCSPVGFTAQLANPAGAPDGGVDWHFSARDYTPGTQSWLSPDPHTGPLIQPQRVNAYSYVLDDPTNLIDPDGRDPAGPCSAYDNRACSPSNPLPSADLDNLGEECMHNWTNLVCTNGTYGQTASLGYDPVTDPGGQLGGATPATNPEGPTIGAARSGYGGGSCIPQTISGGAGTGLPRGTWENIPDGPANNPAQLCEGSYVVANGDNGIVNAITAFGALFGIEGLGAALTSTGEEVVGSSTYIDLTLGKSVANVGTNVTDTELADTLTGNGWTSTLSQDGKAQIFAKNGARYVLRENADSYSGWTADFTPAGASKTALKIRLGYPK